jgi:hypothetical protein
VDDNKIDDAKNTLPLKKYADFADNFDHHGLASVLCGTIFLRHCYIFGFPPKIQYSCTKMRVSSNCIPHFYHCRIIPSAGDYSAVPRVIIGSLVLAFDLQD